MVEAVIFDWDGTLFDVLDFLVDTYTKVFEEIGVKPWSKSQYKNNFRGDWRGMLAEMGLEEHEDLLVESWEKAKQENTNLCLHEGAGELIDRLDEDYLLAIASSAPKKVLEAETKKLGVTSKINVILGLEDCAKPKPNPLPLIMAAEKLGVDPHKCVYVGDMVEDMQAAREAGMASIAVDWGIHSKRLLKDTKPDAIAATTTELEDIIRCLP